MSKFYELWYEADDKTTGWTLIPADSQEHQQHLSANSRLIKKFSAPSWEEAMQVKEQAIQEYEVNRS